MKQLILFLLVHTVIFSQERKNSSILPKKDTISISMDTIMKPQEQAFFSDENLVTIDSLLVQGKLYSSLIDTLDYVLNDKDINFEEMEIDFMMVIDGNTANRENLEIHMQKL